ncbi:MAG TPA: SseB family protein [Bdellovibrionota bacterium]|nr:SseB family protein [Bdellovibrionota bacterium]
MPPARIPIIDKLLRRKPDPVGEALSATLKDPSHAPAFFKALLNTPLHALISSSGELVPFADASGEPFFPFFTRKAFAPAAPEGVEIVEKTGRELLELARDKGRVVINAGRKEFKAFGPEDVSRILDRLVKSRFEV